MTIIQSCVKKFDGLQPLHFVSAILAFPNIIIFENKRSVIIVDIIQAKKTDHKYRHSFENDIVNYILRGHFLWLVLKSSEIYVININKYTLLEIKCNSYANYRIQKIINSDTNLILISESGERLRALLSDELLENEFSKGNQEMLISFEKISGSTRNNCRVTNAKEEIDSYIDAEQLKMKCNTTGIVNLIPSNKDLQHIIKWNEMNVVSNNVKIWILNENFNVIFKTHSPDCNLYPIGANNDFFYFIEWNKEQLVLYNATVSAVEEHVNGANSSDSRKTLSSQEILKSQLETLIEVSIVENKLPDQVIPDVQTLFDEINDYNFLINVALKLCKHNLLYKVILYPLQKLVFAANDETLNNFVYDVMVKTDLLEYIIFRGANFYNEMNIFDMNYIQLCITFISKSDADLASICWLKYSEVKLSITSEDILDILNAIPINIKMGALVIWFRNFIPPLLEQNPFYIDLFVKWTTDRVFHLEQSTYWPKIGLKFIETIVDVLETSMKTICIRPISIDDLGIIKDHINYILELKEKYKINMLLSEFSSQSSSEIALIMLRRCYTEDLETFLQESLVSYASRFLLDMDDILRSYIESEAASCGGNIDGHRLNILLNAFHSLTNRLECLLNVLKILDVPWNPKVLDIATNAAALTHKDFTITESDIELTKEIYVELNYAKIKVILKKYNFPLTCTDYILVIHKLVNSSSVDIEDLKVITTILTDFSIYASTLYIDKCLGNCETKSALEYFQNLALRERRIIIKTLQNKYEQIITGVTSNPVLERNYIDFLKSSSLVDDIQINNLENLYYLKNSYNIRLDLNSFHNHKNCAKELSKFKETEDILSSTGRGRCISQLMRQDFQNHSKLITKLCQTSSSRQARILVESLILYENVEKENNTCVLSNFKDGQNPELLLESYNVLSEVITNCVEEELHHLLKYLCILNGLLHASVILKNLSVAWKFQYIFLSMSSINSLNDLIDFYSSVKTKSFSDSELSDVMIKSDLIPFRIFAKFKDWSITTGKTLCDKNLKLRDKVTKRLLNKVNASQDFDQILVTSLLLTLTTTDITEDKIWILELLKGQAESLTPVAMNYLSSPVIRHTFELENILPANTMSHPPQYILKTKFNINLSEIAIAENTEETWDGKVLLFYFLRHNPHTNFERVVDLCNTLNVSLSNGFSLLLISLLANWDLKYKVNENDLGHREIIIEHDASNLLPKCLILWQSIDDKDFLKDVLNDFWKNGEVVIHGCLVSINPYYYEIYFCIYHLMFSAHTECKYIKEYYLLNFLKGYQRKSNPKQYEFELFSGKGMFPEIGHYRLPFHLFMRDDMWSNLKSEITLETYEYWLPVVALLSLDGDIQTAKDMICSNAVKQTMTTRRKPDNDVASKENEPWRLISREEPLLRTAHRCVSYIANMEWASACLFYVLQGCARGADQVAAAQLCYQFSQRWATVQPGNRAVRQMEKLHTTLSTRHALHKIDWACEELIRLSTEPGQLIQALYLHPNFIDKIARHDINRAANEIADKNSINISSIRIQILENMLDKVHKDRKYAPGLETRELITAKYILKATCPKMGAIYLSRIAFDDESDYNKCKKLRALQCLMSVVEPETLIKVSNRERDVLWTSLLELFYIVNLEKIDMPWIVATFVQNKTLALNQLIQASGNNNENLKIAAELAHKFGNIEIIHEIIPILLRASLFEEMIPLLLKFHHPPDKTIYSAWRAIILCPFKRADYPITERQKAKCIQALNLLPVCPVIKDEDLVEIWKNCVRCKCLGLGCLILPYMTPKTRQNLTELHRIDKRNLIISLKNLISESYLVSGAMYVLDNLTTKNYK